MSSIIRSFCISGICLMCMFDLYDGVNASVVYTLDNSSCTDPTFPTDIPANTTLISIRYCPITDIPARALDHLNALKILQLWYDRKLTTFPNLTAVASTLEVVYLRETDIVYINPTWLNALYKLRKLKLEDNPRLNHIPDVQGMSNLRILELKYDNFTSIPHLTYYINLETLTMKGNNNSIQVSQFHTSFLSSVKSLDVADVLSNVILPTTCPKSVSDLNIDATGSGLDLCDCRHTWLKNAAEHSATVNLDDTTCNGSQWNELSTEELITVCDNSAISDDQGMLYS